MDISRIAHKNLIASGVVALLTVSVGFYLNPPNKKSEGNVETIPPTTKTTMSSVPNDDITLRDTDNDGLLDWEERLRGSDPFMPDTDKDGTTDWSEVEAGRDPAKPAPNDKLTIVDGPNFATSSTDLDGIKKEFFAKYLATASRDIRETTFRDLIKNFDKAKLKPTNELLDLNVSSEIGIDALRAYGNGFGLIINKYTANPLRTEEEILAKAMETKDDALLKDLQLLAIAYRNFSRDLKVLLVPISLAPQHLKIVNGYDGMSRGLLGMQHLFSNPVEGAAGYQAYTRTRLDVITGYAAVVAYLGEEGVTFTKEEPGYPFYKYDDNAQK